MRLVEPGSSRKIEVNHAAGHLLENLANRPRLPIKPSESA